MTSTFMTGVRSAAFALSLTTGALAVAPSTSGFQASGCHGSCSCDKHQCAKKCSCEQCSCDKGDCDASCGCRKAPAPTKRAPKSSG